MNCIGRREAETNLAADALAVDEGSVGRIQVLEHGPMSHRESGGSGVQKPKGR